MKVRIFTRPESRFYQCEIREKNFRKRITTRCTIRSSAEVFGVLAGALAARRKECPPPPQAGKQIKQTFFNTHP